MEPRQISSLCQRVPKSLQRNAYLGDPGGNIQTARTPRGVGSFKPHWWQGDVVGLVLDAGTSTAPPGYCDNLPISSAPEACLIATHHYQVSDLRTETKGRDCPSLWLFFFALRVVDWKLVFPLWLGLYSKHTSFVAFKGIHETLHGTSHVCFKCLGGLSG